MVSITTGIVSKMFILYVIIQLPLPGSCERTATALQLFDLQVYGVIMLCHLIFQALERTPRVMARNVSSFNLRHNTNVFKLENIGGCFGIQNYFEKIAVFRNIEILSPLNVLKAILRVNIAACNVSCNKSV